jgi:hypothetical protein
VDSDGDGTLDCIDNCPNDPRKTDAGECGCGTPDTYTDNGGCIVWDAGYDTFEAINLALGLGGGAAALPTDIGELIGEVTTGRSFEANNAVNMVNAGNAANPNLPSFEANKALNSVNDNAAAIGTQSPGFFGT